LDGFRFMKTVLDWLNVPRNIYRVMAVTLRVTAVLLVPFSLVAFFKAGKAIFDLPASGILGGIVFQILFVLAIYCVVQILFVRARDVDVLPAARYYMFPLVTILLRAAGEAASIFIACIALGGGVYVWFTARSISTVFNPPPNFLPLFGDTTFMGGIEFIVGGLLSAIVLLIGAYLVAQAIGLVGELASRLDAQGDAGEPETQAAHGQTRYTLRSGTND